MQTNAAVPLLEIPADAAEDPRLVANVAEKRQRHNQAKAALDRWFAKLEREGLAAATAKAELESRRAERARAQAADTQASVPAAHPGDLKLQLEYETAMAVCEVIEQDHIPPARAAVAAAADDLRTAVADLKWDSGVRVTADVQDLFPQLARLVVARYEIVHSIPETRVPLPDLDPAAVVALLELLNDVKHRNGQGLAEADAMTLASIKEY